jgi:hypothetical protein
MVFFGGVLLMAAGFLGLVASLVFLSPPVSLPLSLLVLFIGHWFAQAGL